ncbi:MAG: TIGR03862 family flavoprotein [Actinomycetia bacterium]|nr:TIGR03862 family flavoprotein [Actinomycetes bacterium]
MAAEVLAKAGLAVTVYEHKRSVGRKLLLAGRGGLNITHSEPIDAMLGRYSEATPSLAAALRGFTPHDLRAWCAELGEPTFVGSTGRVFPASFRATPLLRAWLARLEDLNVAIRVGHRWHGWAKRPDGGVDTQRLTFERSGGTMIEAVSDVTILALGGASWPRVGSDGRWVDTLAQLGVQVATLRAANCGVLLAWSANFVGQFGGVPLKNIAVTVGDVRVRGDAVVTTAGLEGGPIYAQSQPIRDSIDRLGSCTLRFDLQPDLTVGQLEERLARGRPNDSLSAMLQRIGLSKASIALLRELTSNQVPRDSKTLAPLIKSLSIEVRSLMPIDRAISTAGGVAFSELDDVLMIKRLPGVFVAGEMVDWEAPTGGYLLQASFSTAVLAARGAIDFVARPE